MAFHKRFYWDGGPTRDAKRAAQKRCALVDVVAEDGEEWIKVSTVSEQRLLFELAKARWEVADSSDEEEDDDQVGQSQLNGGRAEDDELGRMELVKTANDLRRASRAHRIHYQHPHVRFVLPKISNPPHGELVPLLERIRSTGATIDIGNKHQCLRPVEDLIITVFPRLLTSKHPPLTPILNIDCTILLALVSDLSYTANHPIQPSYKGAIRRQIELETREHLLPSNLWPAMADRDLVCTQEAARRMREIVDTIGVPNEKARTELIMEDENQQDSDERKGLCGHGSQTADELRRKLQTYSDYPVPSSFRLPIQIMASPTTSEISAAVRSGNLPAVAETVAKDLTEINRSVFMYGWLHGFTTVSSNRTVAKAIENTVEKNDQGEKGPQVWLREPARSLLGKEKERRK